MKKSIFLALAVILVFFGAGCQGNLNSGIHSSSSSTPGNTTSSTAVGADGTVVFSITDAANHINGVSAVSVTIDKIEMHSPAKGWITVSSETKQYELAGIKANGSLVLAAQAHVPEGTYNQVRVHVKKVEVVKSGVRSEAKLPSNTIEVSGQFTVTQNSTTSINLDFLADQSIHVTGNGKFIFIPVVKTQARASVSASVNQGTVVVVGGVTDTDAVMGMDLQGAMRDDFRFDTNSKLEINGDTIGIVGSTTVKADASTAAKLKNVLD